MKIIKILLILAVIVASIYSAIRFNGIASVARKDLEKERFLRISAEEGWEKSKSKVEALKAEVARSENKNSALKRQLEQKKIVNKDLRGRLDKAKIIKENIEKKIDQLEAMVTSGRKVNPTP